MADGPPWTIGTNCNITFKEPSVNGNVATGFYIKPDSYRIHLPHIFYRGSNLALLMAAGPLPAGKRVLEFIVICEDGLMDANGEPSLMSATQWRTSLYQYLALLNVGFTFVDPAGNSWAIGIDEFEDRWAPLGGRFLKRWENRVVLIEL